MTFAATALADVVVLEPALFGDERGWFMESWHADKFAQGGIGTHWVQENHSFSADVDTLRGLHYQEPSNAQGKLVRCTRGAIWDVAVDFRKSSLTYLRHVGVRLDAASIRHLSVPAGFLHSFVTLEPGTEVQYKCSAGYAPDADAAMRWDDPEIAIDWPLAAAPILSSKDAEAPFLESIVSPF